MALWHQGGRVEIGGVALEALAEQFGTPLFVHDAAELDSRLETIRGAVPHRPLRIFYSLKANPAIGLVRHFLRDGVGIDACSPGDLHAAARAGAPKEGISYCGFGSGEEELRAALCAAGTVVLDSMGEVERAATLAPGAAVGLRVNVGVRAGFHPDVHAGAGESKFGIQLSSLGEAVETARERGLVIAGLHAHIGSNVLEPDPHLEALGVLLDAGRAIGTLKWVNLGGGWGTPRDPPDRPYPWRLFGAAASRLLADRDGPVLELRLEPGAWLVMDSGLLLARVVAVKAGNEHAPPTAILDANTNHLPSLQLFGSRHRCWTAQERPRAAEGPRIVGNLMQAGDIFERKWTGGELAPGDLIAIGDAGGYAASRGTTFNERPRPAEVLVDDGRTALLRRAETLEDLFARDFPR